MPGRPDRSRFRPVLGGTNGAALDGAPMLNGLAVDLLNSTIQKK